MMVPERTVSNFSERKRKFLCCVQEVSCSSRAMTAKNIPEGVMHLQSCCFANLSLLLSTIVT